MKAKLIILENPVIVTDEEIKEGDAYLDEHFRVQKCLYVHDGKVYPCRDYEESSLDCSRKIISHNKPIAYNGIGFGIVDVEKLANAANGYNYAAKETKAPIFNEGFIEGFKASQQLNEKKFTLEEMRMSISMARNIINSESEIIKQLSLPKTFEVEIEETPTNIKIIKKL